ncbi:LegC family aminotransferase [Paenibacillus alkalitolerans]|uniref:LegC family aminotransferase n=1 Tax=Paenibacillus alkalitolerans TaxID=2799335 RepID=UPI0018F29444|nr:LegC family aminotransferase [Paenibacillus alkalitolerans]
MKNEDWIQSIVGAVRSVVPEADTPVSLHEPSIGGRAWDYVKDCLDSGWVSSVGQYVDRFERDLARFTGSGFAVATVNGTAALHVALLLAGVKAGDEVVVPSLTFIATANAVSYIGAVPHFADIEERTLGIDPVKLRTHLEKIGYMQGGVLYNRQTNRPIRAVVPMHTFGHPVDLDSLAELCDDFGMALVEDAAESLGSYYKGKHTGTFGVLSSLSFNGNKIVTTGGGGAILTDDPDLAKRAKHLTTTAKLTHAWEYIHDAVGFNYRLPNINAALGCAQLEQLTEFVEAKRRLFSSYDASFAQVEGVRLYAEPEQSKSNYWLQTIILEPENAIYREDVLFALHEAGYLCRPAWRLINRLEMYAGMPSMDVNTADSLAARIINIPSGAAIG